MEIFFKKSKVEEIRSGVEVPCNEKDNLLEEVSSMCKEANYSFKPTRKKTGLTKDQQLCLLGKNIRNKYAENHYFFVEEDRQDAEENTEDNSKPHRFEDHDYVALDEVESEVVIELSEMESASLYDNSRPGTSQLSSEGSSHANMNKGNKNSPIKQSKHAENTESTSANENVPINQDSKHSDGTVARNVLVPTRKRRQREPVRKNALSYLSNKQQTDLDMKQKEIDLENWRLDIEQKT